MWKWGWNVEIRGNGKIWIIKYLWKVEIQGQTNVESRIWAHTPLLLLYFILFV